MIHESAVSEFLTRLPRESKVVDRAVALLWIVATRDPSASLTPAQICAALEKHGWGQQNRTRLGIALRRDRRVTKDRNGGFRLRPDRRDAADAAYAPLTTVKVPAKPSDSVIPIELFAKARPYIQKVAVQINGSYDFHLYDCTAVMSRRLLETLIIETFEVLGRADDIRGSDGNFFMFSGLLKVIEADKHAKMSRNCLQGLKDFKRIGDQSAHNRFFLATKKDIEDVRHGLRVAAEELLHRCSQA